MGIVKKCNLAAEKFILKLRHLQMTQLFVLAQTMPQTMPTPEDEQ